MATKEEIQQEVDDNFEFFKEKLPELAATHLGKYALLRHQKLVDIFDSAGDAKKYAEAQYKDGIFSIQHIIDGITNLGYFSYGMSLSTV